MERYILQYYTQVYVIVLPSPTSGTEYMHSLHEIACEEKQPDGPKCKATDLGYTLNVTVLMVEPSCCLF
jgi:hypothetical protein